MNLASHKTGLTVDIVSNIIGLKIVETTGQDWSNNTDNITAWRNKQGNFILTQNTNGSWNVFFGLEFVPSKIKDNLILLEDLQDLYRLLTGESLMVQFTNCD